MDARKLAHVGCYCKCDDGVSIVVKDQEGWLRRQQASWRALTVHHPFVLTEIGVLATVDSPLAEANLSLLVIFTFDADYRSSFQKLVQALSLPDT